jgi:hypothetical protein
LDRPRTAEDEAVGREPREIRLRHNSATTLSPTNVVATRSRGKVMRDIRCDLQERVNVVEEQIRAIYAHFEKVVQQLECERDARVAELQGTHTIITQLLEFESAFMGNVVPLENPQAEIRQDKGGKRLTA